MKIEIDSDIYKWLCIMKVLTPDPAQRQKFNFKYTLDDKLSERFLLGLVIGDLFTKLQMLAADRDIGQVVSKLNSLKQNNGSSMRIYNWNVIQSVARDVLDYEMSDDFK